MKGVTGKKAGNKYGNYVAYGALTAVFALLLWMNVFYLENWIDSDMAAEMIFSRLLTEEGRLIATPNWFYSTEFRVLYTQLFMVPLFHLFDSWHTVRVLTNLITYALVFGSYLYMVKPLGVKRHMAVLTSLLLLIPFSETFATHVQMGNTYMPHMIIICFVAGMFFRLSSGTAKRKWILLAGYLFLCLVCGLSGVRYLLALQAPLVLTSLIAVLKSMAWKEFRRQPSVALGRKLFDGCRGRYAGYSLLGAIAAVAGYGLNVIFVASSYKFQTYEATNFISVYQGIFLERVQNTLGSLLMLFGYIPDKGFISVRGLITLIAFVLIGGIIYVTVRSMRLLAVNAVDAKPAAYTDCATYAERAVHTESEGDGSVKAHRRYLLWLFVTAFALNTFVFVFTNSTLVPRYYLTVYLFVPAILAIYLEEEKLPVDRFLVCFVLSGCMLLAAAKTVYSYISTDKNENRREVAAFLEAEDYTFGYATYWHANIMQELTDGAVEVANLYQAPQLEDFHWSSPVKYYDEAYHTGKVFLLLTVEEAAECAAHPAVQKGKVIYEDAHYVVYHFDSMTDFAACREIQGE